MSFTTLWSAAQAHARAPAGTTPEAQARQLRARLYAGDILLASSTPASRSLVDHAWAVLHAHLGDTPRDLHRTMSGDALFRQVGRVRAQLYEDPHVAGQMHQLATELGLVVPASAAPAEDAASAWRLQPPKLRAIGPGGHRTAAAAPVYYAHRDTWYAEPPGVINLWIALHPTPPEESFELFPRWFDRPVPNDSATFDYDAWRQAHGGTPVGWQRQSTRALATYPRLTAGFDPGRGLGFAAGRGEVLVFCGSHLHRTCGHDAPRIRYSIDARLVHLGDHLASRGAPQVDNASRGSALEQYTPLPMPAEPPQAR